MNHSPCNYHQSSSIESQNYERTNSNKKSHSFSHYPCEYCALTFKTTEALDFHLYKIHKCKNCAKVFTHAMGLVNHVSCDKSHSYSPQNGRRRPIWPEYVGYSKSETSEKNTMQNSVMTEDKKFNRQENKKNNKNSVKKSDDQSTSKANLSWSLSLAPDPEILQNQRKHKCDKCSAAYKQKCSLKSHMAKCGLPRNFKCQLCECAYFEQKSLDRHFKDIHDSHHPCEYCTLVFKTPDALEFHLYSMHKCKTCGTVFSNMWDLKSHGCLKMF